MRECTLPDLEAYSKSTTSKLLKDFKEMKKKLENLKKKHLDFEEGKKQYSTNKNFIHKYSKLKKYTDIIISEFQTSFNVYAKQLVPFLKLTAKNFEFELLEMDKVEKIIPKVEKTFMFFLKIKMEESK